MPPVPHESWFAYHIHARHWLRSQFPAFARREWLRWRALAVLPAAALAGASAIWFAHTARIAAPAAREKPASLPALSPIADLTPARELSPGSAGVRPVPATLTLATPPAAPPLKQPRANEGDARRQGAVQ
ncbi:hypothetical protein GJ654_05855 [Rhodoblastus acidophilus]|uniref:Uncharacterized protein n=1 Tax=Rhodoblastus acidophilus TaxID=1074 RepID=A0A6N8DKY0_RHOAC|nr:hypothetical protein [Rhodoblastus acidophilus]MCW2273398.1 hypothetical protein [Rhodoblastus acidophilus]MTV30516.1 hypothetical protein [Rhodoblastus acidophilus]